MSDWSADPVSPRKPRPPRQGETSDQYRVLQLLATVRRGEDDRQSMTSDHLVNALGWSASEVASCLAEAKARLLVWWIKGYGPGPRFEEIELTTQGRRLLNAERPNQTSPEA